MFDPQIPAWCWKTSPYSAVESQLYFLPADLSPCSVGCFVVEGAVHWVIRGGALAPHLSHTLYMLRLRWQCPQERDHVASHPLVMFVHWAAAECLRTSG